MKIERELADGRNLFTGYGAGYVEVNGKRHTGSVVVNGAAVREWSARSVDALAPEDLAAIVEARPEILLIGTGANFQFPDPATLAPLHAARLGVEVMDTPAACRTYNILMAEGRNVMAALIL